jgi:hypothetical protein
MSSNNQVVFWVDAAHGNDSRNGQEPGTAFKTVAAAWRATLTPGLAGRKLQVNFLPGRHLSPHWLPGRADGSGASTILHSVEPRQAIIEGGLNIKGAAHLELRGLTLAAGGGFRYHNDNVLHLEACSDVAIQGCRMLGTPDVIKEVVKINQSARLLIADNEIAGCNQAAVDLMACQYAEVLDNQVHNARTWGVYDKGGSAYVRIAGNDVYDCGFGISTGEGSGLQYLVPPFLQYESYGAQVFNNFLRNIKGTALCAQGALNAAFAHNWIKDAAWGETGYTFIAVRYGDRKCSTEADIARCRELLAAGAWGSDVSQLGVPIPCENLFFYNNRFSNEQPTRGGIIAVAGKRKAVLNPAQGLRAIYADKNLKVAGNVFWNPGQPLLGTEHWGAPDEEPVHGAQPGHPSASPKLIKDRNKINAVDPFSGYALPRRYAVPQFPKSSWAAAGVPAWNASNTVKARGIPKR